MDQKKLAEWKARDPMILLRQKIDEHKAREIEKRVDVEMEAAIEFAKNSPEPSIEEFLASIAD